MREAIVSAADSVIAERGLAGLSMSEVAVRAAIGRATLYKYFSDVASVLGAWHQAKVAAHLRAVRDAAATHQGPAKQLQAALTRYAEIRREHPTGPLGSPLHSQAHVHEGTQTLITFLADLISAAARDGDVRTDVPPRELATFCLGALDAADGTSRAAATRLVDLVLRAISDS